MIATIPWLCLGVYLAGWLVSIPVTLRRDMLRLVCSTCHDATRYCPGYHRRKLVAVGSFHERSGADVAWSALVSLAWPVWLLRHVFVAVMSVLGRGVMAAVAVAAPLTAPEIERRQREQAQRIQEQQDEIERLGRQLAEK